MGVGSSELAIEEIDRSRFSRSYCLVVVIATKLFER
jgi:hypothetical protein